MVASELRCSSDDNLRPLNTTPCTRTTPRRTSWRTATTSSWSTEATTTLEATAWWALHTTSATTTLELSARHIRRATWPDPALFDVQPVVADRERVRGDGSIVTLGRLEVDEGAVLHTHVSMFAAHRTLCALAYLLASNVKVSRLAELLQLRLQILELNAFMHVLDVASALWALLLLLRVGCA